MTARPLAATYRLQLRAEFPLDAVRAIVPYLHRLGVSHIYSSPVLASRPGSTHGYDVADPTRIDPELGDEGGRLALVRELHRHEMGWLLDIVPNHMGTGPSNPFWEDVLARGRASRWAHWFDVDWADRPQRLRGRILLPVLGDDLDAVIERGELSLVRESGAWRVKYFDNSFPVSEESLELLGSGVGDQGSEKGGALIDQDPTRSPDPSTLRAILDRQHYLLANWRRAAREINYRRFFDVNELVALRVEDPRVFAETHALVLEWVGAGEIDGLRIDHIDGLLDPLGYLERLRAEVEARAPRGESAEPFPVVVEKILSPGEHLRREWPVQGTTGYEFLDDLEAVLIDSAGFERIEAHYRRLLRIRRRRGASAPPLGFAEVALRGKLYILRGALRADIYRLARQLVPIAKRDRAAAKLPREALVEAMTQLIAALPVYRTYIDGRAPAPSLEDEAVLDAAFAGARRRGGAPPEAIDFLERTILRPIGEGGDGDAERERLRFIQRLQQTTGPATAKGVEDTALYIYVPLVSRNEVGSDPARELVDAVETLHRANGERATVWPRALITTDTHDTKRSADVRARLDVLAELPEEWAARVLRWRRLNRVHRTKVHGRLEPDANTEYLLYQSMVGVWEVQEGRGARDEGREEPGGSPLAPRPSSLVDRLTAYILKAAREAKMRTSWTDRNEEFEGAIVSFVRALLHDGAGSGFLDDLDGFVRRIAPAGWWNALARVVLHLASPGTPDVYQGNELWSHSLVDPDNRRPVDYALREKLLAELDAGADPAALLETAADGRIKLWVTSRTLRARRADAALWREGRYTPLHATGARAAHVVAFARELDGHAAIAVAPRLPWALGGATGRAPVGPEIWGDTAVALPPHLAGRRWTCALSGDNVESPLDAHGNSLRLADVCRVLPVALLQSSGTQVAH